LRDGDVPLRQRRCRQERLADLDQLARDVPGFLEQLTRRGRKDGFALVDVAARHLV
jgi:hypothetical protein